MNKRREIIVVPPNGSLLSGRPYENANRTPNVHGPVRRNKAATGGISFEKIQGVGFFVRRKQELIRWSQRKEARCLSPAWCPARRR
jgi:hypothetical protein